MALEQHGVHVLERVSLEIEPNATNRRYLVTKAARMGHLLNLGLATGGTSDAAG